MNTNKSRCAWKGLLAGAAGGLIGSFAMGQFSSLLMPQSDPEQGQKDPTVRVASSISQGLLHHSLTPCQKKAAGPVVHYLFGASMGAAYGALVEFWESAQTGWGLPFGAAVWLGAHVIAVPALGLSQPITRNAPVTEAVEGAAHLVYGAFVETARRALKNS